MFARRPDLSRAAVVAPLMIEAPDVCIEAFGEYDATGALVSLEVNGRPITLGRMREIIRDLCGTEIGKWDAPLCEVELRERLGDMIATAAE